MNSAVRPAERPFLEAVAALAYANPFSPEREDWERRALGDEFLAGEPIWSVSVADPERARPNIWRIQEKLGPVLEAVRERLLRSEGDFGLYEECVHSFLYQKHYESFAGEPIWSVSVADPERARPNIWRIQEKLGPVLEAVRERLLRSEGDFGLYEECVHSFLYQKHYESFAAAKGNFSFYRKFAADWAYFFDLPGKRYETALGVDHFFACCWQLARAFHGIFDFIIGSSRPAARLRGSIWESIFTCDLRRYRRGLWAKMGDFPTLITGPSGTGKELVARAIAGARYLPFSSARGAFEGPAGETFFAVNLAALSPALIESELFGHRRGAFTGAIADRVGWLEACPRQGAVFLDELGEMEMTVQVKLLRVMETRQYAAVGDTAVRRFEGKLIAATNRDLGVEIAAGRFREDLYYRLCADLIRTPSLAEQVDSAPEVFEELVMYMTRRTFGEEAFPEVMAWMREHLPRGYRWPGNYRELEQCVRNVMIRRSYVPLASGDTFFDRMRAGSLTADEVLNGYVRLVYGQCGSYVETARRLGLDRRTVRARVEG